MKICPMGAEMLHTDGWTQTHDGTNSRFPQCMYVTGALCNDTDSLT